MSRILAPFRLSTLADGVNRFEQQAKDNQCVDALDAWENEGYLERRPGFQSIATGPVFLQPAGKTVVVHNTTIYYNRQLSVTATSISNVLYVGSDIPFDGIDWRYVTAPTNPTAHRRLAPKYWNGSAWTAIPGFVDTTISRLLNGANIWLQTLCKDGRISWHRTQLSGWTTTAVQSLTKYWVRLDISPSALTGTGSLTLAAPGARVFLTEPITSIIPCRFPNGLQSVLIGADRQTSRGVELGGNLGIYKGIYFPTQEAFFIEDEGSGVKGQVSGPAVYTDGGDGGSWSSGWSSSQVAAGTLGTSGDVLTKFDQRYDWLNDTNTLSDQHRGAVIYEDLAPTGGITNSGTTLRGGFTFSAITGVAANRWEGCRIRCTTQGTGGPAVGEEREIISNTTTSLLYHDNFSAIPATDSRFCITKPHSRLRLHNSARLHYEIVSNAEQTATIEDTRPFHDNIPSTDDSRFAHWEIGKEFPWSIESGEFWSSCYDSTGRQMLFTNGPSGILKFDGLSIRRLTALSDPENARLQEWVGVLNSDQDRTLMPNYRGIIASQVRRAPPKGKFITDFMGRIVVADNYYVKWSAPGSENDIWPYAYETQIRDSENRPIEGLTTLNDQLVVWTKTSIHVADPPDDNGIFSFRPISQGLGFLSARVVNKIAINGSSFIIGANTDGVYLYNGSEPRPVLDDWRRIMQDGVNPRGIHLAVGAISKFRTEYYLAVPSSGSSVLDRVLVYNWTTRKWWVFTAPWGGISAIGTDLDEQGFERVLFGFKDGHIAILNKRNTDDGDTVTGYAKSILANPAGAKTIAPVGIMVEAKETGTTETLTVKSYLNKRGSVRQTFAANFNDGAALYDTALYGTDTYSDAGFVTKKLPMTSGTRAESYQFEIRGTGQWRFRGAELLAVQKGQRSK